MSCFSDQRYKKDQENEKETAKTNRKKMILKLN